MRYLADDGRIAEVISRFADKQGNICVMIDGEQKTVNYDKFIHEFRGIAKENYNEPTPNSDLDNRPTQLGRKNRQG